MDKSFLQVCTPARDMKQAIICMHLSHLDPNKKLKRRRDSAVQFFLRSKVMVAALHDVRCKLQFRSLSFGEYGFFCGDLYPTRAVLLREKSGCLEVRLCMQETLPSSPPVRGAGRWGGGGGEGATNSILVEYFSSLQKLLHVCDFDKPSADPVSEHRRRENHKKPVCLVCGYYVCVCSF